MGVSSKIERDLQDMRNRVGGGGMRAAEGMGSGGEGNHMQNGRSSMRRAEKGEKKEGRATVTGSRGEVGGGGEGVSPQRKYSICESCHGG